MIVCGRPVSAEQAQVQVERERQQHFNRTLPEEASSGGASPSTLQSSDGLVNGRRPSQSSMNGGQHQTTPLVSLAPTTGNSTTPTGPLPAGWGMSFSNDLGYYSKAKLFPQNNGIHQMEGRILLITILVPQHGWTLAVIRLEAKLLKDLALHSSLPPHKPQPN
jgi:hypothetical protein